MEKSPELSSVKIQANIRDYATRKFVMKDRKFYFFEETECNIYSIDNRSLTEHVVEEPAQREILYSYCEFNGSIYLMQYADETMYIYMLNENDYSWDFLSKHPVDVGVQIVCSASSASEMTVILIDEDKEMSYFYSYDHMKNLTLQQRVQGLYYEHLYIPDNIFD